VLLPPFMHFALTVLLLKGRHKFILWLFFRVDHGSMVGLLNLSMRRLRKLIPHDFFLLLWYHRVMGFLAALRYGFPGTKIPHVIGITGTDGKSSTCFFTAQLLEKAGKKVGLATTVGFWVGEKKWKNTTHKTTMGRFGLQKLLKDMVEAKVDVAVIEVSSHGLVQSRLSGIRFDTAVITNLHREHLDYHRTMDGYMQAKGLLFKKLRKSKQSTSIVYDAFDTAPYYVKQKAKTHWTYGIGKKQHCKDALYLYANTPTVTATGQDFTVHHEKEVIATSLPLQGSFNVLNGLAAMLAAKGAGVPLKDSAAYLSSIEGVPGRMEEVPNAKGLRIFIDYAVTPKALTELYTWLSTIKKDGKVRAVLGACGDRDKEKRPEMGMIATSLTDQVYITNEEPYSEDPKEIIAMLCEDIQRSKRTNYEIIEDRREAIVKAISDAKRGDIIVITGMGDQTSMVIGEKKIPWSDREEVLQALKV